MKLEKELSPTLETHSDDEVTISGKKRKRIMLCLDSDDSDAENKGECDNFKVTIKSL